MKTCRKSKTPRLNMLRMAASWDMAALYHLEAVGLRLGEVAMMLGSM